MDYALFIVTRYRQGLERRQVGRARDRQRGQHLGEGGTVRRHDGLHRPDRDVHPWHLLSLRARHRRGGRRPLHHDRRADPASGAARILRAAHVLDRRNARHRPQRRARWPPPTHRRGVGRVGSDGCGNANGDHRRTQRPSLLPAAGGPVLLDAARLGWTPAPIRRGEHDTADSLRPRRQRASGQAPTSSSSSSPQVHARRSSRSAFIARDEQADRAHATASSASTAPRVIAGHVAGRRPTTPPTSTRTARRRTASNRAPSSHTLRNDRRPRRRARAAGDAPS